MAHERGETNKTRHTDIYFHGKTAKDDFLEILRRKYGTLTRAWRVALDVDDSGLLDAREFAAAMKVIGYVGNVRSLWFNLDDDQSGTISLKEIDPDAAEVLEKFRAQCTSIHGSMDAAWDLCLDKDKSGALTLPELEVASLELGYTDTDEVDHLFDLLRTEPAAFRVLKHEALFLQRWEERKQITIARSWRLGAHWVNKDPYLWKEKPPLPEAWKAQRQTLCEQSKAPAPPLAGMVVATEGRYSPSVDESLSTLLSEPPIQGEAQRQISPKGQSSGNFSNFHKFRKYAAEHEIVPKSREGSKQSKPRAIVPIDFDEIEMSSEGGDSNYEAIVAIDQQRAWKAFETHLIDNFGSLPKAFDVMDSSGDGQIEREEWMHTVTRRLRYCRASEALRLFDSKVKDGNCIKWEDLGISSQEWILYTHNKRLAEQQIKNRKKQMKPMAFGGEGLRRDLAVEDHEKRMKAKPKKPPEAFWTTLPNGWGFPPTYIDARVTASANRPKSRSQSSRRTHAWS
jgi:hypothetical protein